MPAQVQFSERIKWETFARVLALTMLLFFGIAMDLGFGPQPIAQLPEVVLYKLITTFYVLSFLALLATYLFDKERTRSLAWASLGIDIAFAAGLVAITHGTESVFLFALPLTVLSGAALLQRPGAFVAASAGTVVVTFLVLVDAQLIDVDLESLTVAWLRAIGPRDVPAPFDVLLQGLVQVAALYATALLSSQLVVELSRARARAVAEGRELAALRVRYEDVWSSLPLGLATLSSNGLIRTANPAFLRILTVSYGDVIGQPLAAVLPELDTDPSESNATIEIARPDISPTSEVLRLGPDGGGQQLTVRTELLRDAGSDGRLTGETLLLVRDVTRLRRREQDHRNRERLATVGAMAMAIAHEIRNPLASISGAVQMLESGLELDEESRSLMDIAVRETEQLSGWIGEFLDYAKPGSIQLEPLDLGELVEEKLAALAQDPRISASEVSLDLQPTVGETRVIADRKSMSSLVWNLLRNAVDAVLESDERRVQVCVVGSSDAVTLVIDDSGPGVPEVDRGHLFEPFFTTRQEGTGLGLATVRRVVDNHRGQVEVSQSRFGGASFVVTLPKDLRYPTAAP